MPWFRDSKGPVNGTVGVAACDGSQAPAGGYFEQILARAALVGAPNLGLEQDDGCCAYGEKTKTPPLTWPRLLISTHSKTDLPPARFWKLGVYIPIRRLGWEGWITAGVGAIHGGKCGQLRCFSQSGCSA